MNPLQALPSPPPLVDNGSLETLRTSLRGDLIGPEDLEYNTARLIWNGMIDRRPAAIAR